MAHTDTFFCISDLELPCYSYLMAPSSSSSLCNWRYNVFASFHGPDARKSFLSHLRRQFNENGITMFDDQGIERGQSITPALRQAIRESRILILVLTKNYASSSWCLDELLEILKCKEAAMGQMAMTVFYGVDPSDVRKQTGDFGIAFNETCARKTEEERRRWSKALTDVGNIAGEHFLNWDNEAKMIKKIAIDVSDKLNATPSRNFDGMVGLEPHLREMEFLLDLDNDEVMMAAITGTVGIGKTTIARALHSRLSNRFQLTCFVDNLRRNYHSGLDELRLQEEFLSKVLNQNGVRICHRGVIKERLRDQRVLIILDDVSNIKQLEALANETTWFGPGSRIVVTTEDKEILQQHGINKTYHVEFPSDEKAFKILCRYAFKQSYPHDGFKELAKRVTELCGNLPLGLRVVGSSLRGKKEQEWEEVIRRLETFLDHRDIEEVLRVGYESLHENEQSLFFHIVVFFNYKDGDIVKAMFADNNNNLDIKHMLKILVNRSLIHVSTDGEIVMHKLLQQVGRRAINRQEPWARKILIDAPAICDVLERAKGTRAVSGISFDISDINEVSISERAFKRMPNLRFLKVYRSKVDGDDDIVHIPEEMEFPHRLRLLHWEAYPLKCLPRTFCPKHLVELDLRWNLLEKLWEGTQQLPNLKKMNLYGSSNLKELPDLSNATNLERLDLSGCQSLVEIPSSIGNLHKLEELEIMLCANLKVVTTLSNLSSLKLVNMVGCWQLRKLPNISNNITKLTISDTMLEQVPESARLWSRLHTLIIWGSVNTVPYLPKFRKRGANVERIPDFIKDLRGLKELCIYGCPRLSSLPELPPFLRNLTVNSCESLKTITFSAFDSQINGLSFPNCFKLDREARGVITQQSFHVNACLPGRKIPAEFNHGATGNSLTIRSRFNEFRICLVLSPQQQMEGNVDLLCRVRIVNIGLTMEMMLQDLPCIEAEHVFMFYFELPDEDRWRELEKEILFEFSTTSQDISIIECGVQILMEGCYEFSVEECLKMAACLSEIEE